MSIGIDQNWLYGSKKKTTKRAMKMDVCVCFLDEWICGVRNYTFMFQVFLYTLHLHLTIIYICIVLSNLWNYSINMKRKPKHYTKNKYTIWNKNAGIIFFWFTCFLFAQFVWNFPDQMFEFRWTNNHIVFLLHTFF